MAQLTISSLIAELTKTQAEHGDLPVVILDADTSWPFKLKAEHIFVNDLRYLRNVLEIAIEYTDEPDEEDER